VVEKVLAKGTDYLSAEIKRLEGMINSASVSPLKKTGFMIRKNILNAFLP
jgi:protein disulfide-isomerase A6